MIFKLPRLSFNKDALKPYISEETIEYHYGKHHQIYLTNLNRMIAKTEFENKSLIEIIKTSTGEIFNNAAQHLNHTFYWDCLTPDDYVKPSKELLLAIKVNYGSFKNFTEEFNKSSLTLFGSGWTWLVKDRYGEITIINTANAENPIAKDYIPLLVCDVWEHAYYIDYRNARDKYLNNYWHIINWKFVNQNFLKNRIVCFSQKKAE